MKTQFGELVTGDFEENTLTIEIDGEMVIQAGRYALVPIDDYNQLVKNCDLAVVVGQSEQLFCHHEGKYTLKSDGNCCKCHLPPDPKAK